MSGSALKTGDPVRLRSGGAVMAVGEVAGTRVRCTWFDDDAVVCSATFDRQQLESWPHLPEAEGSNAHPRLS